MQSLIFDKKKQKENLERFLNQFIFNDFLYRIGAEIIFDCAIRSNCKIDNLLLYGYFGRYPKKFYNFTRKITQAFIVQSIPNIDKADFVSCSEESLPFESNTFDMAFSNLSLHFINNIQLALINYNKLLKKDSVFAGTILGDYSFFELRESFNYADEKLYGGIFSRIMPMINSQSIINLMNAHGFHNTVVHVETLNIQYNNIIDALRDLRQIGFNNFLINSTKPISSNFLKIAEDYYYKNYAIDNKLNLTLDIIVFSSLKK